MPTPGSQHKQGGGLGDRTGGDRLGGGWHRNNKKTPCLDRRICRWLLITLVKQSQHFKNNLSNKESQNAESLHHPNWTSAPKNNNFTFFPLAWHSAQCCPGLHVQWGGAGQVKGPEVRVGDPLQKAGAHLLLPRVRNACITPPMSIIQTHTRLPHVCTCACACFRVFCENTRLYVCACMCVPNHVHTQRTRVFAKANTCGEPRDSHRWEHGSIPFWAKAVMKLLNFSRTS